MSLSLPAQFETDTRTVFIPSAIDAQIPSNKDNSPEKIGGVHAYINYQVYSSATSYKKFDYFLVSDADKNTAFANGYRGNINAEIIGSLLVGIVGVYGAVRQ